MRGQQHTCFSRVMALIVAFSAFSDYLRDMKFERALVVGASSGIGAALVDMRPIVEVMTVNFSLLALDQVINNASTLRHMSGGQVSVPLVIRMATGAGRQPGGSPTRNRRGPLTDGYSCGIRATPQRGAKAPATNAQRALSDR